MSIESRGAQLAQNLAQLSKQQGFKSQVHLITHSFCGVDARAALSLYGAGAQVRTLTTLSSPHKGMRLIDNCISQPEKCPIEPCEKAFEAVGISQKAAFEFTSENIRDFNKVAEDARGVEYFSIGAHKQRLQCSDLLRTSHENIVGGSKPTTQHIGGERCDGIVRPEEAGWGRYLMTFPEHDHLELVGFNSDFQPNQVYSLIVDNLRLSEIKDDPTEAKQYGVDHLFSV